MSDTREYMERRICQHVKEYFLYINIFIISDTDQKFGNWFYRYTHIALNYIINVYVYYILYNIHIICTLLYVIYILHMYICNYIFYLSVGTH